jgi:hypothetical protein
MPLGGTRNHEKTPGSRAKGRFPLSQDWEREFPFKTKARSFRRRGHRGHGEGSFPKAERYSVAKEPSCFVLVLKNRDSGLPSLPDSPCKGGKDGLGFIHPVIGYFFSVLSVCSVVKFYPLGKERT